METLVRIEKEIPLTIFDEPVLKEQVTYLFNSSEEKIKARVNEILTFLDVDSTGELSYDNIVFLFKSYFYKLILNEAVEMTFSGERNYDALSNILSLLSEERLENAIMGEPMIDAISNSIRSIPTTSALSVCVHGGKILLLEKEFLGRNVFPTFEKRKKGKQRNYCDECRCSCTCDGECRGNIEKCTSKEAIEKGCTHHCGCYINPMVKNFPK